MDARLRHVPAGPECLWQQRLSAEHSRLCNTLSGTLRIQAEDFDNGGKGVAYYNTNSTNPGGQYRTNETVGIQITSDTGGGYNVGWTAPGGWLEYTIKVPQAGMYDLHLRVAGTTAGSVRVFGYGTDLTGAWTLPNTGGAQTWQTVVQTVFLTPGQQKLRLQVLTGGFNLNWIELSPTTSGPVVNGTYKILNAASGAALDLDTNNIVVTNAYSGSTTQQWTFQHIGGGQYRVNSLAKGNSWYAWAGPLRLLPWGWGAGGDTCYIFRPTDGGYYRFCTAGGGTSFGPDPNNPPKLDDAIYTGAAAQQWAVLAPGAPAFPVGLSATAVSATQTSLTWSAVPGATSYNVKRSTTTGGAYTTVATGVATTNYTDTVVAGTTYYYVVSAVVGGVESSNSLEATVPLPFPWLTQDVGAVGVGGSAAFAASNNVFSANGSGADIWGTADAFRFVYVPVTGNCTAVARVLSVQNVDAWSKAGVMIRESLNASSTHAFVAVTPGNGVAWQNRPTTGGNSSNNNTTGLNAPFWVKLVRSGNTFTGYRSPDGTNWTQIGSIAITMSSTVYAGLALTSHNNSSLCAATFDNVTLPGWPALVAPTGLIVTSASSNQVSLAWNSFPGVTSYHVKHSLTNGGPYSIVASGITATNFTDSGLISGAIYYYVVSAMTGARESSDSLPVSVTTLMSDDGSLVHRYSFLETSGTNVADSVGGPAWTGTLPNGGGLTGAGVTLSPASQQFVALPAGIVGSLSNFTIMAWVSLNSVSNWSRIFDFGNNATTNMFLTPQNGIGGTLRFAITTNGGGAEQQINCSATVSTGAWHYVAVTLSGTSGVLYLDGVAVGTNSAITIRPSSMGGTANNYLGKSQYNDPYLDGALRDFRVYDAALSPAEMAATAALGPGQLLNAGSAPLSVALAGTNATFSWPLANAGFRLQARTNLVLGNWADVTLPAPQIDGERWRVSLPRSNNLNSIFYRLSK